MEIQPPLLLISIRKKEKTQPVVSFPTTSLVIGGEIQLHPSQTKNSHPTSLKILPACLPARLLAAVWVCASPPAAAHHWRPATLQLSERLWF
ncbi:unnamed protein product [Periconia digitata]|uniref:Uncharacterized protein n=1 Tax=Periconia digitata TaxID=1303443 RepID=A0A9W4U877_9PLEO|nr:unnamed protein product [Periconia digitata]